MAIAGRRSRTLVTLRCGCAVSIGLLVVASAVHAQDTLAVREVNDSVTVRFVDADLRAVVQSLAHYLPKPILMGNVPGVRVFLESPGPVPRHEIATLLRGLIEAQGLRLVEDTSFFRVDQPVARVDQPVAEPVQRAAPTRGQEQGVVELFVIRLRHARAADVAATVSQLFGAAGAYSGGPGLGTGTLSDELRRNRVPPAGAPEAEGRADRPAAQSATLEGPVTIVPDDLTNSLLVRATEADFAVLEEAVQFLDIRPLQVLIEVLIVEARADRSYSLGADLLLPTQELDGDATVDAETVGGGLGDLVIRIMNLGRFDLDAVIRAAASKGNARIVSRPVLLASNNTEARFLVGAQRPFVQVSRSLPTDAPSRDQVVQYRDVGTKLTVLPTINQDGYVSLLVQQEVNAATNETQFDAPIISTREAATRVLIRDGQTIVIGGLRDRQRDHVHRGVPIFSDLPLIGGLFGSSSTTTTETELYIFITPRILRDDADADGVTAPRLPSASELKP